MHPKNCRLPRIKIKFLKKKKNLKGTVKTLIPTVDAFTSLPLKKT